MRLEFTGFDWDAGNRDKNRERHSVEWWECEEVFFNRPLLLHADSKHSKRERRYQALGQTNVGRLLFLSFTQRNHYIRIISARDQSRKERRQYEQSK